LVLGCSSPHRAAPRATGGVLDLRQWSFADGGAVTLAGEWALWRGALVAASAANPAAATARVTIPADEGALLGAEPGARCVTVALRVLLPPAVDGESLTVRLNKGYTATALRAGDPTAGPFVSDVAGVPSCARDGSKPLIRQQLVTVPWTNEII